jgi:putative hemolysin
VPSDGALVVAFVTLFILGAVIAAGETSLIRTPHSRAAHLAETGRRGGRRLLALADRLPEVLNAVLLAALLSQIGAATIVGILAARWFGAAGVTIASVALTVVLFVYAEAIPKTFAVQHSDRVALALSGPLTVLEVVLRPVVSVLVWFADLQMPGKGITTSPTVTEGELRSLARRAAKEGEISHDDSHLIERAFRLGDRKVDDIIVPRADIVGVDAGTSVEDALAVAVGAGHRRIVVFGPSPDEIVGVVRLRDLVAVGPAERAGPVGMLGAPPLVVPETKRVLDLLREMQATRNHLAVVVDEYGATAGLVTIEDIVEELVGSVSDDDTSAPVVELGPGRWSVDGLLPVEDLEALVGEPMPEGGWNTVAGLVMGVAGRVPGTGDEVEVAGLVIKVVKARRRRVVRLEVSRAGPR